MSATLTRPTTRIEPERPNRTVEEAAVMVNVSAATFWRWIYAGRVNTVRAGKRRLVPLTEIDKLLIPQRGR